MVCARNSHIFTCMFFLSPLSYCLSQCVLFRFKWIYLAHLICLYFSFSSFHTYIHTACIRTPSFTLQPMQYSHTRSYIIINFQFIVHCWNVRGEKSNDGNRHNEDLTLDCAVAETISRWKDPLGSRSTFASRSCKTKLYNFYSSLHFGLVYLWEVFYLYIYFFSSIERESILWLFLFFRT